jgi:hypothetical protein
VRLEPTIDRPVLTIATSRYQAGEKIAASELATVGTTVGKPKFPLGYELAGMAWKLAPHGCLHIEDRARFTAAYRGRLNRVGVAPIRRLLAGLRRRGAEGVVLLCFEHLDVEGVAEYRVFLERCTCDGSRVRLVLR